MKKIIYIFYSFVLLALAIPVFGAPATTFRSLIDNTIIGGILKPLVPLLIGLAVIVFIYGVLLLMFSEGGEKKEEGKQYMLWGIIGIFVMVSVWGLVAILSNTLQLDNAPKTVKIELK
jgi:hypothetical protein